MMRQAQIPVKMDDALVEKWRGRVLELSGCEDDKELGVALGKELGKEVSVFRSRLSRFLNGDGGEIYQWVKEEPNEYGKALAALFECDVRFLWSKLEEVFSVSRELGLSDDEMKVFICSLKIKANGDDFRLDELEDFLRDSNLIKLYLRSNFGSGSSLKYNLVKSFFSDLGFDFSNDSHSGFCIDFDIIRDDELTSWLGFLLKSKRISDLVHKSMCELLDNNKNACSFLDKLSSVGFVHFMNDFIDGQVTDFSAILIKERQVVWQKSHLRKRFIEKRGEDSTLFLWLERASGGFFAKWLSVAGYFGGDVSLSELEIILGDKVNKIEDDFVLELLESNIFSDDEESRKILAVKFLKNYPQNIRNKLKSYGLIERLKDERFRLGKEMIALGMVEACFYLKNNTIDDCFIEDNLDILVNSVIVCDYNDLSGWVVWTEDSGLNNHFKAIIVLYGIIERDDLEGLLRDEVMNSSVQELWKKCIVSFWSRSRLGFDQAMRKISRVLRDMLPVFDVRKINNVFEYVNMVEVVCGFALDSVNDKDRLFQIMPYQLMNKLSFMERDSGDWDGRYIGKDVDAVEWIDYLAKRGVVFAKVEFFRKKYDFLSGKKLGVNVDMLLEFWDLCELVWGDSLNLNNCEHKGGSFDGGCIVCVRSLCCSMLERILSEFLYLKDFSFDESRAISSLVFNVSTHVFYVESLKYFKRYVDFLLSQFASGDSDKFIFVLTHLFIDGLSQPYLLSRILEQDTTQDERIDIFIRILKWLKMTDVLVSIANLRFISGSNLTISLASYTHLYGDVHGRERLTQEFYVLERAMSWRCKAACALTELGCYEPLDVLLSDKECKWLEAPGIRLVRRTLDFLNFLNGSYPFNFNDFPVLSDNVFNSLIKWITPVGTLDENEVVQNLYIRGYKYLLLIDCPLEKRWYLIASLCNEIFDKWNKKGGILNSETYPFLMEICGMNKELFFMDDNSSWPDPNLSGDSLINLQYWARRHNPLFLSRWCEKQHLTSEDEDGYHEGLSELLAELNDNGLAEQVWAHMASRVRHQFLVMISKSVEPAQLFRNSKWWRRCSELPLDERLFFMRKHGDMPDVVDVLKKIIEQYDGSDAVVSFLADMDFKKDELESLDITFKRKLLNDVLEVTYRETELSSDQYIALNRVFNFLPYIDDKFYFKFKKVWGLYMKRLFNLSYLFEEDREYSRSNTLSKVSDFLNGFSIEMRAELLEQYRRFRKNILCEDSDDLKVVFYDDMAKAIGVGWLKEEKLRSSTAITDGFYDKLPEERVLIIEDYLRSENDEGLESHYFWISEVLDRVDVVLLLGFCTRKYDALVSYEKRLEFVQKVIRIIPRTQILRWAHERAAELYREQAF